MGLRLHDLVRISGIGVLLDFRGFPEWTHRSLGTGPFVVVRRAKAPDGFVPIGIRGEGRSQRAAALLPLDAVEGCITPEDLAVRIPSGHSNPQAASPQFARLACPHLHYQTLRQVAEAAEREGLSWGPIGSVGFGMATGAHVIRKESDLDILVRLTSQTNLPALKSFRATLAELPVRVDILLEADGRAAVLDEYLRSPDRVLIKTPDGPQLGAFPG